MLRRANGVSVKWRRYEGMNIPKAHKFFDFDVFDRFEWLNGLAITGTKQGQDCAQECSDAYFHFAAHLLVIVGI